MIGGRVQRGDRARRGGLAGCVLLACLAAAPAARAQTAENPQALDQLGPPPGGAAPIEPPAKPPVRRTLHPSRRPAVAVRHPSGSGLPNPHAALPGTLRGLPAPTRPGKPGPPTLPANAPPPPVLPPPIVVPTRPQPPPPPVPVMADAPGIATRQKDGLRVTFGADRADLNPATDAAIRAVAHTGPPFAATTFTVTAYAAGNADDPSTPRRLALARGLAVRSVLIAEGIPSTRIYVKALGASVPPGDAPADRVDVVASVPPPSAPAPGASLPAGTAPPGHRPP